MCEIPTLIRARCWVIKLTELFFMFLTGHIMMAVDWLLFRSSLGQSTCCPCLFLSITLFFFYSNLLLFDFILASEILKGFITTGSILYIYHNNSFLSFCIHRCVLWRGQDHISPKGRNCSLHTQCCITRGTITDVPPVLCFLQYQIELIQSTERTKVMGNNSTSHIVSTTAVLRIFS